MAKKGERVSSRDTSIRIRSDYAKGTTMRELVAQYGFGYGTINNIIKGYHYTTRDLRDISRPQGVTRRAKRATESPRD